MYELISLKLKCPVCGESLMDDSHLVDNEASILLDVEMAGKKGEIRLSSVYGSYNYVTDIEMPKGEVAKFSCPHCKKSLIQEGSIQLKIDRGEKEGFLMLSPYLNIFTSRSTIRLTEDEIMSNIRCFHCNHSLEISGEDCGECGSRVARVVVGATSRLVDFYICAKKGCTWHGLSREDMNDIRLEQSLEW